MPWAAMKLRMGWARRATWRACTWYARNASCCGGDVVWAVGQERSSGANRKEQPTPNGASGLHHIVRLRRMTEDEQALASALETSSGVTHCTGSGPLRCTAQAEFTTLMQHEVEPSRSHVGRGRFLPPLSTSLLRPSPVLPTPPRSLPPRWTTLPHHHHHHLPTCTKTCNPRPTAPAAKPGTGPRPRPEG